tara:strand:- start:1897 stop:3141 length:1245 start_codon:yes stop_codon:yes gene_type:complete
MSFILTHNAFQAWKNNFVVIAITGSLMKFSVILRTISCVIAISTGLAGKDVAIWTPQITRDSIIGKANSGETYWQAVLGIYMRAGEAGIKVNFGEARKWSQKAAKAGDPLGLYNLGNLALLAGDFEKSNEFYQDAQLRLSRRASEGDPIAQYAMGEICFYVRPKNPPRAIAYFQESAASGYPQAQATLGALHLKGLPPLLPQDFQKGIGLLVEGARRQSMTSRYNLGMAYYNSEGVPKDNDRAIRWLRLAAEQNFAEAQYSLATLLFEENSNANKHEAIRLLQRAAAQDHTGATEDLSKYLSGVPQQTKPIHPAPNQKAREETQRLAKECRVEGQKHYNGQGTKQNHEKAYACFKKAAELGDPESQRYLALMLFHGKGCGKDRNAAGKWFRQAASLGDTEAKRILTTFAHFFKE